VVVHAIPLTEEEKQQLQGQEDKGDVGDVKYKYAPHYSNFLFIYTKKISLLFRVAILKRNSVPEFGPPLPLPPIFYDRNLLRVYLLNLSTQNALPSYLGLTLLKFSASLSLVVSATMSSLRAPKFKEQMLRTQKLGLQNIIDSYCPPQEN